MKYFDILISSMGTVIGNISKVVNELMFEDTILLHKSVARPCALEFVIAKRSIYTYCLS